MGRPINKRYFGALTDATEQSATNPTKDGSDQAGHVLTNTGVYSEKKLGWNIPVRSAFVAGVSEVTGGEGAEYPFIVSQKGSRSYRVRTSATAAHIGKCKLVNKASGALVAGEMVLQGFVSADSGVGPAVNIAKLTKFYATDFSGNRYKWYIAPNTGQDSSQANTIVLVAATDASIN
jgi:hypothetical protein